MVWCNHPVLILIHICDTTLHYIRLVPRLHLVIVKGGLQNELGWQLTTTRHVCCLVVSLPSHILSVCVCITMRCESDERHLHHITPDNMVVNTASHNIVRDGELLSPTLLRTHNIQIAYVIHNLVYCVWCGPKIYTHTRNNLQHYFSRWKHIIMGFCVSIVFCL